MAGWNAITGARGIVAAVPDERPAAGRDRRRHHGPPAVRGLDRVGVALYVRTGTDAEAATSPVVPARWPRRRDRASGGRQPLTDARGRRRPGGRTGAAPLRCGDAPDALGGGAAPHLHRRRAGPAPPRRRGSPQRARGDRADLRRDVRGGPRRGDVRGGRGRGPCGRRRATRSWPAWPPSSTRSARGPDGRRDATGRPARSARRGRRRTGPAPIRQADRRRHAAPSATTANAGASTVRNDVDAA